VPSDRAGVARSVKSQNDDTVALGYRMPIEFAARHPNSNSEQRPRNEIE
jgi:hypothetical protein